MPNTEAFLRVVRAAHPDVPIVFGSPLVRADAESTPNELGATQIELRLAQEDLVQQLIDAGDDRLALVPGLDAMDAGLLADGVHPSDEGHAVLARLFGDALRRVVRVATGPPTSGGDSPMSESRDGELVGKAAIVTGAGAGLGNVFARALAAEGAMVAIADVDLDVGGGAWPTELTDAGRARSPSRSTPPTKPRSRTWCARWRPRSAASTSS